MSRRYCTPVERLARGTHCTWVAFNEPARKPRFADSSTRVMQSARAPHAPRSQKVRMARMKGVLVLAQARPSSPKLAPARRTSGPGAAGPDLGTDCAPLADPGCWSRVSSASAAPSFRSSLASRCTPAPITVRSSLRPHICHPAAQRTRDLCHPSQPRLRRLPLLALLEPAPRLPDG